MSEFENPIEEDINIVTLTGDDGTEQSFEFLDLVEYEGKEYCVLLPIEDPVDEEDEGVVIILEVKEIDDETEEYTSVDDEGILDAVFEIFKERFQSEFNFED